ncbi:hypothetical protein [Leekyejoonella antrihumi]|uniref:Uncharacterized protein n=1 Tax=Leekyejoonella antrihumi TaxID=1660198 RepID=A0A563EA43_9MICO|nr:hypothetical protein [Leekyejoonella antrihumi]TWP38664.1 hypothetical protein FGL98_02455 [Leekyejoonella antrihumi]
MTRESSWFRSVSGRVRRVLHAAVAVATVATLVLVAPVGMAAVSGPGAAGTVYVQTVPALAGVRLSVAGIRVTTGSDGSARVKVSSINHIAQRVVLAGTRVDGRTTVALSRVSPQPHAERHTSRLDVGLQISSVVRLAVASGRSGIAAGDVSGLRLHSLSGKVLTVDPRPGATVDLLSRRAVLQAGVLTSQTVTWSVDRVTTRSGAAVTTSSPRFDPFSHSLWTVQLAPVAGTVEVDTVPATPGVMVVVGGHTLTTGANGRGSASTSDLNSVSSGLKLATPQAGESSVELLHVSKLPPHAPRHRRLLLALKVSNPVTFTFVDPRGHVIPLTRVGQVRLDQAGHSLTIDPQELAGPVLLPTSVAKRAHDVWRTDRLDYSIEAVSVSGANAVFSGQHRFDPRTEHLWRVRLSVYDMSITVRDALLGRRTSSTVQLTSPDGRQQRLDVGDSAPTVLSSLVRGTYHLVVGAAVVGADHSVLVSRSSVADLRVITLLDLVIIACVIGLLAAALIVAGRRLAHRATRPSKGEAS